MKAILFLTLLLAAAQAMDLTKMEDEASEVKDDLIDLDNDEEWDEEDLDEIMSGRYYQKRHICSTSGTTCGAKEGTCQSYYADASSCERLEDGLCGYGSCKCCIDCQANTNTNCYTSAGKCKKKDNCGLKEYLDTSKTCNAPDYCGCCRKCDTPSDCANGVSPGFCIGNTRKLTEKHYLNTTATCTQGSCTCYNRCVRKRFCADNNGRCIVKTNSCRSDETKFNCGCRDSENCACCIKTSIASGLNC